MRPFLLLLLIALANPMDGLAAAPATATRTIACHSADCPALVVKAVAAARTEVRVAAVRLTQPDILKALTEARLRGIEVEIILDRSSNTQTPGMTVYNGAMYATNAGIPVWITDRRLADNIIIDGHIVLAGRAAFAAGKAGHPADATLNITDDAAAARHRLADWQSLRETSRRYVSTAR